MENSNNVQGNIRISDGSWTDLIEDLSLILNQAGPNFEVNTEGFRLPLAEMLDQDFVYITKVYLCQKTASILLEPNHPGLNKGATICLGKVLNVRALTGRVMGDLICASRAYREDGNKLYLSLL